MARSSLLPYAFVWAPCILYGKNVENFKRLLWSLLANVAQILCGAFLGWGNERLLEWLGPLTKMAAMPIYCMVKTFKSLLLQNQTSPGALSLHKSSGTGDLPELLKIDVWPFYGKVKFASPCICMGRIHLYWKNVENSCFDHLLYNPVESKRNDEHKGSYETQNSLMNR